MILLSLLIALAEKRSVLIPFQGHPGVHRFACLKNRSFHDKQPSIL